MSIAGQKEISLMDTVEHTNEALLQWIKENQGYIHESLYIHSEISDNNIYRTVRYNQKTPILRNDPITQIPSSLVISQNTFHQIPNINHWIKTIDKDLEHVHEAYYEHFKIMVALLYERDKQDKSFYAPYINTLPSIDSFDNHPIILYFQDKYQFNILNKICPYFIQQVEGICHELFYLMKLFFTCNNIYPIFNPKKYSAKQLEQLFQWAFIIKKTRSWDYGLIPFNDLFNHHDDSAIKLKKISQNKSNINLYIFKADNQFNTIEPNAQVYNNYGYHNGMLLYIFYNFLQPKPISHLFVSFDFSPISTLNQLRIERLKHCKLDSTQILLSQNGPTKDLLTIVRILCLSQKELLLYENQEEIFYEQSISDTHEIKTLQRLLKIILDMKMTVYSLENMNFIHDLINAFKNRVLSSHESVIKNICLIMQDEYKIIEDNLCWISQRLHTHIEKSKI